MSQSNRQYQARVSKIVHHGNYAVVYSLEIPNAITFSIKISDKIWLDENLPIVGSQVILGDLRKMDGGWRAFAARYYRPEDDSKNPATSK